MNATSDNKLPDKEIYYFRQRYKNRVFQAVVAHFASLAQYEGLTKKDLAERLGKEASQITRWLSGPGNLTLDTISDLLLAMNAEMSSDVVAFDEPVAESVDENCLDNLRVIQYLELPESEDELVYA